MKKLLFIFSMLFLIGCQDKEQKETIAAENALFETAFSDFKDVEALADYEKETDTSVHMGGSEDNYRLLNLRQNNENLVLFYKVADRNSSDAEALSFRAVDTLQIQPEQDERISLGYCYHKEYYEGELVALVKKNDSLQVGELIRVWRANRESESFEIIENFEGITCLNEGYEGEETSLRHLNLQSRTNQ